MEGSKIQLSPSELELACNREVILTKNSIINKTVTLFELLGAAMVIEKSDHPFFTTGPKVSRGENYGGLPYIVLDYPRHSTASGICFIRTFFWWGNFFSSTLQISGSYKEPLIPAIAAAKEILQENGYNAGTGKDPWQHHFEGGNYQPLTAFSENSFLSLMKTQDHIKIAARWPLSTWDGAPEILMNSWKRLSSLIT